MSLRRLPARQPLPDLSSLPSLRDLMREEAAARRAVREAADLDQAAEEASDLATRNAARRGALAARRRVIARRLRFLDTPADLAARLEGWADGINDPAVLDRLIDALTYTSERGDAA